MQFNSFLWKTYLDSADGQRWAEFFAHLQKRYEQKDNELKAFIDQWASDGMLENGPTSDDQIDEVIDTSNILKEVTQLGFLGRKRLSGWPDAETYFREVSDITYTAEDDSAPTHVFYANDIPRLSVALFFHHPNFFFPYYFYPRFHALKQIFDEFGIELLPAPAKRDQDERFFYYLKLCGWLYRFSQQHGIAPEHVPVFLYGFAPQVIQLNSPSLSALDKPQRAWFVGGGIGNNGDFQYLDGVSPTSTAVWQGNAETQPGDIVVMYCLTPRSHVHSIWRAVRPGAIEPFRHFYSTIWIGYPRRIAPISLSEIKADPVLSQMPLVKGNMQGINGRQIHKRFYDRLLCLAHEKGTDISTMPQLEDLEIKGIVIKTERDVEQHILEPLLLSLGFVTSDWIRQMKLRVGRADKVIPDYVIFPRDRTSARTIRGAWVWEVKLSISTDKQLQRDFEQASSYARLVGAAGVSLISKEGIWLSLKQDGYMLDKRKHWSATQSHQSDHLNEIREFAGKRKMLSYIEKNK